MTTDRRRGVFVPVTSPEKKRLKRLAEELEREQETTFERRQRERQERLLEEEQRLGRFRAGAEQLPGLRGIPGPKEVFQAPVRGLVAGAQLAEEKVFEPVRATTFQAGRLQADIQRVQAGLEPEVLGKPEELGFEAAREALRQYDPSFVEQLLLEGPLFLVPGFAQGRAGIQALRAAAKTPAFARHLLRVAEVTATPLAVAEEAVGRLIAAPFKAGAALVGTGVKLGKEAVEVAARPRRVARAAGEIEGISDLRRRLRNAIAREGRQERNLRRIERTPENEAEFQRLIATKGEILQLERAIATARQQVVPEAGQVARTAEEGIVPPPAGELPRRIIRQDVPTGQLDATKPQGLYFTFDTGVPSPHLDVGDVTHVAMPTPTNVLHLQEIRIAHPRFGRGGSGVADAGVTALKRLMGDQEFERLRIMSKRELADELTERFPGPNYMAYDDAYDLLSTYGGQMARERGHDALVLPDNAIPSLSEYVALQPQAFEAAPGAVRPQMVARAAGREAEEAAEQAVPPVTREAEAVPPAAAAVAPPTPPRPPAPPTGGGPPLPPPEPSFEEASGKLLRLLKESPRRPAQVRREAEAARATERMKRGGPIEAIRARRDLDPETKLRMIRAAQRGEMPVAELELGVERLTDAEADTLSRAIYDAFPRKGQTAANTYEAFNNLILHGKLPTRGEIISLGEVFGDDLVKELLGKRGARTKGGELLLDLINLPRSWLASFDLSAPLRQGIVLAPMNPRQWGQSFKEMVRAFGSEKYTKLVDDITKADPLFDVAERANLYQTPFGEGARLSAREETFISRWAERIPIVGIGVKASQRSFVTFLNRLRFQVFKKTVQNWEKAGKRISDRDYETLADFLNAATGRGNVGKIEEAMPYATALFFSPRLQISRIQTFTSLMTSTPEVRKVAAANLVAFFGTGATILGLLKLAGVKVEVDPRSPFFGRVIIGNTSLDFWGGFQSIARYMTQFVADERKILTGPNAGDISPPFGSRAGTLSRFGRTKLAPFPGMVWDWLSQENIIGEPVPSSLGKEFFDRLTPLFIQDLVEAVQEYGAPGALIAAPGAFGASVLTIPTEPPQFSEAIDAELGKLGIRLGDVGDSIQGLDLTEEQHERYKEEADKAIKVVLERLVASAGFQNLPDEAREKAIKRAVSGARTAVREQLGEQFLREAAEEKRGKGVPVPAGVR